MKWFAFAAAILGFSINTALALDGQVGSHDPSTVIECNGKYYVYSTGTRIPILESDDGWTWRTAGNVLSNLPQGRPSDEVIKYAGGNNGTLAWAPDVAHVGDKYFMYYALSGSAHRAVVALLTNKTLDPNSPDYKWEDGGPVAWSLGDGKEELHAIDPGVFHDPNDASLWLVYGSYFGTIRLAQLDPTTGKRLHEEQSKLIVANQSEASDLMYHDGWYYLLTNHGTCCRGGDSTYNIRVGRSKTVTGPYLDDHGVDMARGGGKLFAASQDQKIGPGHFGLLDLGDEVQKFSCHYEADLDHGGISVVDLRPLLWRDGWPVAGENLKEGTHQLMAKYSGSVLELAVQGISVAPLRGRGPRGAARAAASAPTSQPSQNWPPGPIEVRTAPYLLQSQQKWTFTPIPAAGGTPGAPYFKITAAGTDRALAATEDDELISVPTFSPSDPQLWRIDELADGSYRIAPKSTKEKLALTSIGRSTVSLEPFTQDNEHQRWLLGPP
jgi:arabinan endo-1,5-alpha-L-arabinosidase